jgi:hypothetical protein
MFQGLGLAVQDVATVVVLFLPGFVAVSLFEFTNPQIARQRPALQWTLWSLATSLVLFAGTHGVFRTADWPRDALDPEFYLALLGIAAIGGYAVGRSAGSDRGRQLTKSLKILLPPWVWVEVLSSRAYAVLHLDDGTVLFGYPRRYTDDPKEQVREVYLEQPMILARDLDSGEDKYVPLPEADGVLVESSKIRFIEMLRAIPDRV